MSQYYYITKIPSDEISGIVYSLSYDSPMNHLASIERDLANHGIKGKVCFDLLLSNGNTSDRFYCAFFDGNRLSYESLKKESDVPNEIYEQSLIFYSENEAFLANSVLNRAQRFLIKKKKHLLRAHN